MKVEQPEQDVQQVEAGEQVNGVVIEKQAEAGDQVNGVAIEKQAESGDQVNGVAIEKQAEAGDQVNGVAIEKQVEAGDQVNGLAIEKLVKQDLDMGEQPEQDVDQVEAGAQVTLVNTEQPKIGPGFISAMLRDGSLSAEGLASKGFLCIDSDESDSDEDSDDSSDSEEDEESDKGSSSTDSEEDDGKERKSKAKTASKGKEEMKDSEDTRPPRTKHELDVLPPVPKVTAVLEPHHETVDVGHISFLLDLKIIVEASISDQRILNEKSILWLTESRMPLGFVDEVFGPVKNPFYVIRFNELSEIPEDAQTGVAVSYVNEFSDFLLKDHPSLYRKAVDASGLDDEELASDEDLEFSDDEKEAAARLREKSKRGLDSRENRPGQGWNLAESQHTKGQRTERGRGRGRVGGRGAAKSNAVDSAADVVADMDLRGSPWHLSRPGIEQRNGRSQNRERWNSPQHVTNQELRKRGSGTGPANGFINSHQHQESQQNTDGPYFGEQASSQSHPSVPAQQAYQAGVLQGITFNAGAVPALLQGQGIPTQQPTKGFQPYGYNNAPGYDAQFGMPGQGRIQGNFFTVPGGPQLFQNPGVFNNPNPFLNVQGNGQMNIIGGPGYGSNAHEARMNYGVPVHHSLGDMQADVQMNYGVPVRHSLGDMQVEAQMNYGVPVHHSLGDRQAGTHMNFGVPVHCSLGDMQAGGHPSLSSFMAPAPVFGSGMVGPDDRAQSMPQNSQNQGPTGGGRASYNGPRDPPLVHHQRSYYTNKGFQGQ